MVKSQVTFAEISPSEFFYRNRDLAGFSNPSRALYSATRELVENSLDACEIGGVLPDIFVRIIPSEPCRDLADPKTYVLKIQDNGPGINPKFIPQAFGRVFFGSKFKLKQARGMFGMGGTMSILYGQITTHRPVTVVSSTGDGNAYKFEMMLNIRKNEPIIMHKEKLPAEGVTGTSVEISLQGDYFRAAAKIQDYFRQTAVVTPYANIVFVDALGRQFFFERATKSMPTTPRATLPHPHGIDVEALRRLLIDKKENTLMQFMYNNFHRVGENTARKFLEYARMDKNTDTKSLKTKHIVTLVDALHRYDDFLKPDGSCLSPIGKEILEAGIKKELQPEFIATSIRPPSAYSGFPFIVEVSVAYGGKFLSSGLSLFRFANRIPLLYDEGSDISYKIVRHDIDWKYYHIGSDAPIGIITHVCSTKIPYKTVGKEYLSDRPELERELKNAIRDSLRQLKTYLSRKGSIAMVERKMNIYGKYLPLIAQFVTDLSGREKKPNYHLLLNRKASDDGKKGKDMKKMVKMNVDNNLGKKIKEEMSEVERQTAIEDFGR